MGLVNNINRFSHVIKTGETQEKIFFLHVHKCGGTSLAQAIGDSFGIKNSIFRHKSVFLDSDASLSTAKLLEEDVDEYRKKLLLYYMHQNWLQYITGHFCYSEKAMSAFGHEWNFVTTLREPVSRWFSHYFMDSNRKHATDSNRINLELEDFLQTRRALWEARKLVLTFNDGLSLEESDSDEAVNQAIRNLEKFALVGTLDNLDEFSKLYYKKFGFKLDIPHHNTSLVPKQKQGDFITDDIKQKVEEMCSPSKRVYEGIKRLISKNHFSENPVHS